MVQTPLTISELAGQVRTQDFKSVLTYYPVTQAAQVVLLAQVEQLAIVEQLKTVYNYLLLTVVFAVVLVVGVVVVGVVEAAADGQANNEFGQTVLLQGIPKAFENAEHDDET